MARYIICRKSSHLVSSSTDHLAFSKCQTASSLCQDHHVLWPYPLSLEGSLYSPRVPGRWLGSLSWDAMFHLWLLHLLRHNLISWSAKKQPTISHFSCESEYRAMENTATELVWLTHLLRELHALLATLPTLLCDNKSALFLIQNHVSHKRTKHLNLTTTLFESLSLLGSFILILFLPCFR